MKKLNYFFLFVLVVVLISGCSEFETNHNLLDQENTSELKKAKVPIPAKCWTTTVPDLSNGFVLCTPAELGVKVVAGGNMSGIEAHGGKLDTEKSTWEVVSCDIQNFQLIENIEGKHTVMNGDYFLYTGTLSASLLDGAITGTVNIYEGTGKFEGGTAEVSITGILDFQTNVATMKGEGFWTFNN
jgi:hypothetical protein